MPKVFISYSHDNELHKQLVCDLSDKLCKEGIDCIIDQYEQFPEKGWPNWMLKQIRFAEYVLIVFSEVYTKRLLGEEIEGAGLGATWEGQIITQKMYSSGGRNSKFIPVIFKASQKQYIPDFIAGFTYYNLDQYKDYFDLYRLLTNQPKKIKPPLGEIIHLPNEPEKSSIIQFPLLADEEAFDEIEEPTVIWKLPRGFLLIEKLTGDQDSSWAVVINHYDYHGKWLHGTHYHESYNWSNQIGAYDTQCFKLGIPQGDYFYAISALNYAINIREGAIIINDSYSPIDDNVYPFVQGIAEYYVRGSILLPKPLAEYLPIVKSGILRDYQYEISDLGKKILYPDIYGNISLENLTKDANRLRRQIRIEMNHHFAPDHPARINAEELLSLYPRNASDLPSWLDEINSSINDAINEIEQNS